MNRRSFLNGAGTLALGAISGVGVGAGLLATTDAQAAVGFCNLCGCRLFPSGHCTNRNCEAGHKPVRLTPTDEALLDGDPAAIADVYRNLPKRVTPGTP